MSDLHDMAADLSRVASADYQPLMRQIGDTVLKFIDARTPYKRGELLQGNTFNVVSSVAIEFSNSVDHAIFVHNGTKPHVILPKFALASSAREIGGGSHVLAFEIGGQMVFTNVVRHPGNKANPFMENGINDAIPAIEDLGVRYLTNLKG